MIYALDANGLFHWQFRSTGGDGVNGVRALLSDFYSRMKPDYVVACLDGPNNWRKQVYPEYKAHRPQLEQELIDQLKLLPEMFDGICTIKADTFEADDLIASVVSEHAETMPVCVVSSDKDLMQLVSDSVTFYDVVPRKKVDAEGRESYSPTVLDVAGVTERWGVEPARLKDLLSLMGDASDNVPGVKGWGQKTATKAVTQTKSMIEIIRRCKEKSLVDITPKLQDSLISQLESLELSRKLIALRYDAPIPALEQMRWIKKEA